MGTEKTKVELFTDGACSGNPGPGGWGAILRCNGIEKELSGGSAQTTNNKMELTAVIECFGRTFQRLGGFLESPRLEEKGR